MSNENNKNYIFTLLHGGRQEREPEPEIHYDPSYFSTLPGILKIIEVVLNLFIFIIISLSKHSSLGRLSFMSLAGGIGFIISAVFLGCHVNNVVGKYKTIPWLAIEIGYSTIWAVLLAIGSTVCLLYIGYGTVFGIVPFFGYINTVIYSYHSVLKFQSTKKGKKGAIQEVS